MMTGRELILYILVNNLEDSPVINDGKFIGFMTEIEAAEKFNVGIATIRVWVNNGLLQGVRINDVLFIPVNSTHPILSKGTDD